MFFWKDVGVPRPMIGADPQFETNGMQGQSERDRIKNMALEKGVWQGMNKLMLCGFGQLERLIIVLDAEGETKETSEGHVLLFEEVEVDQAESEDVKMIEADGERWVKFIQDICPWWKVPKFEVVIAKRV
jgi:hypothetical protein